MKTLFIICFFITHIHSLASVRVATVDMDELFNSDPMVIAIQKKVNAKNAEIKADNEKHLKEIRKKHVKIEALSRKIENPQISEKEKQDLIRERQLAIQSGSKDPFHYQRKLKKMQRALNIEITMGMRKVLFRIQEKTQNYAEENNIHLLLNKSLKDKNQRLVLVYATAELDITKQFQAGEIGSTQKGIELNELKVATINLNLLPKEVKPETIAKIVANYAKKNAIHLVFNSSAESTTHSSVVSFAAKSLDITDQIAKQIQK